MSDDRRRALIAGTELPRNGLELEVYRRNNPEGDLRALQIERREIMQRLAAKGSIPAEHVWPHPDERPLWPSEEPGRRVS